MSKFTNRRRLFWLLPVVLPLSMSADELAALKAFLESLSPDPVKGSFQ